MAIDLSVGLSQILFQCQLETKCTGKSQVTDYKLQLYQSEPAVFITVYVVFPSVQLWGIRYSAPLSFDTEEVNYSLFPFWIQEPFHRKDAHRHACVSSKFETMYGLICNRSAQTWTFVTSQQITGASLPNLAYLILTARVNNQLNLPFWGRKLSKQPLVIMTLDNYSTISPPSGQEKNEYISREGEIRVAL